MKAVCNGATYITTTPGRVLDAAIILVKVKT